jgi:hypothetical protein
MMENDIRQLQDENDLLVVAVETLQMRVAALEDQADRFVEAHQSLYQMLTTQAGKTWVLLQMMSTERAWTMKQLTVLVRALEPREGWAYRKLVNEVADPALDSAGDESHVV